MNEAIRLDPKDAGLFPGRAEIYMALGEREKALADCQEAIRLDPKNVWGHWGLAACYRDSREFDKALAAHDEAVRLVPQYGLAYAYRADVHRARGDYAKALADYNEAIRVAPENGPCYAERGNFYLDRHEFKQAAADYDRAAKRPPIGWHYYKRRAVAHFQLQHYDKALESIAKAVELKPDDTSNLSWIPPAQVAKCSDTRLREGLLELADKTIEKTKGAAGAYAARGILRHAFGHQEEALADFRKALELRPEEAGIWYQCALTQLAAKQTGEYQATCRRMVGQFSEGTAPADDNFIAWACTLAPDALSDWVQAVAVAEKAAQSDPKSASYLNTWGAVLYRAGRFDDALSRLSEAEALVQPSSEANNSPPAYTWFFLAMTQHCLGHAEEAKQWLDKAVAWTDKIFAEADQGTTDLSWNRRLTLKLLREEAEGMIVADTEPEDNTNPSQRSKPEAEG